MPFNRRLDCLYLMWLMMWLWLSTIYSLLSTCSIFLLYFFSTFLLLFLVYDVWFMRPLTFFQLITIILSSVILVATLEFIAYILNVWQSVFKQSYMSPCRMQQFLFYWSSRYFCHTFNFTCFRNIPNIIIFI